MGKKNKNKTRQTNKKPKEKTQPNKKLPPHLKPPRQTQLDEMGRDNFILIHYDSFLLKTINCDLYLHWISLSFYLRKKKICILPVQIAPLWRTRGIKVATFSQKLGSNLKNCFRAVLEAEIVMFGICTIMYFYTNSSASLSAKAHNCSAVYA